jgi:hypothetical protein
MLTNHRLALSFDVKRLKSDLVLIEPTDWIPHFNSDYFDGDWSGVALQSADGNPARLYTDPTLTKTLIDTPVLARCRYFQEVLSAFSCPIKSARLLKLGPGSVIREHRDYNLSFEDGTARIHIPISTDPLVEFIVDNRRLVMNEGEAWYINFNLPHRLRNLSDKARIHLVIDCAVNDWLSSLIPSDNSVLDNAENQPRFATQPSQKSEEDFDAFRNVVLEDLSLQKRLRETPDVQAFLSLVLELGEKMGYSFSEGDVRAALSSSRLAWNHRWMQDAT